MDTIYTVGHKKFSTIENFTFKQAYAILNGIEMKLQTIANIKLANLMDRLRYNKNLSKIQYDYLLLRFNNSCFLGVHATPVYAVSNYNLIMKSFKVKKDSVMIRLNKTYRNDNPFEIFRYYLLPSDQKEYFSLLSSGQK